MASGSEDDSQKTEQPTERRLEEASRKGQIVNSREVTSFLFFLTFLIAIWTVLPYITKTEGVHLAGYISNAHDITLDSSQSLKLMVSSLIMMLKIIILPLIFFIAAAIGSNYLQNLKINFSKEAIAPKLERISPLAGLKRLFSRRSLVEFLKGIIKILIVSIVSYKAIEPNLLKIKVSHELGINQLSQLIIDLIKKLFLWITSLMAFIAALDFFYQRFEYMQQLMMSKQELKEEFKETEGNPEIKAKLRRLRMERSRRRMMAAVPDADVIITNPTHYAVALKYEAIKMVAPMVVAKGKDNIALQIRKIAKENDVPIVENPPLARVLVETVEIDQEIPFEHYKAVAEIISYVYKLKGK